MNNYIQPGDSMNYVPDKDVASGEPVLIGSIIGVAETDVPAEEVGAFAVNGVFALPKASGTTAAPGTPVYLNTAGNMQTAAVDGQTPGYVFEQSAVAGEPTMQVKLAG